MIRIRWSKRQAEAAPQKEHLKAKATIMAISISRLKTWSAKTNRCSVTMDTTTTMADKVKEVVEVATKLTVTRIAWRTSALLKVEAAEAEASIEVRITIEGAAITTTPIMITEIREEGVTIVVIATNMVTIVVDASAAADIMTLIEEGITTAEMVILVVVIEIRMIVSL